jgi:tryptophan-rich sensory protein
MITPRHAIGLAVSLVICFGAAGLGSLFTMPSIGGWYVNLSKPAWTPPNWLFGPVWTGLYLCMAIAAWLVWRKAGVSGAEVALALFALQLALNVCWSAIFFSAHMPGFAFAEIVLLWLLILATVVSFWPVSRAAGWLLVPYLLWVGFAAALNYAIWRLNA